MQQTLDARKDGRNIVRWAPSVLQDIKTKFSIRVNVGMEHSGQELDSRWLIWVTLVECQRKFESAIFKRCVRYIDMGWRNVSVM
jgi:uncharacterized protein YlxP (DUF503 family)